MEIAKLSAEEKELKHLKAIYKKAAEDIAKKIEISNGKISVLLEKWDDLTDEEKSIYQSQIYQRDFQRSLQKQIDGFLTDLNSKQYKSIDEYMNKSYETGYIGSLYDLHGQGIPLIMPIDQKQVVKAVYTDSKISKKLYEKLGEDVAFLKKRIANNLSRGIATADSYSHIARNIAADSNVGFNRAMRIARTEGHRIQAQSAFDAQHRAKEKGADVVKQWDAALDKRTRESHARVDGEIRELDEKFSNGLMYPGDSKGGAAEVVNCRCALLQRAKWALDEDELETLKQRAEYFGLDKADDFNDFKKKYLNAVEKVKAMPAGFIPAKTIEEATKAAHDLGVKYAVYDDLPLETANLFNQALMTVPEDVRPVFVGDSKTLEKYWGAKLKRSSKNFYGVSVDVFDGIHLGMNQYDFDTYGNMVAISSSYKTAEKITKAKKVAQADYVQKHGTKWFFNENGESTPFHEMGHAYAAKKGMPKGFEAAAEKWAKESGCDMLKKPSEAWAEAWAAYYTKNPDLPDYISEFVERTAVSKAAGNTAKGLLLFDGDSIILEKIEQFKKDFEAGKISTKISYQKQGRHIKGRKEFEAYKERMFAKTGKYPSYVREDLTSKDLERLVVPKLQGNVQVNSNYEYREFVKCDEVIGYYYDKAQGKYVATDVAQIKYALGDKNIHIIPVKSL